MKKIKSISQNLENLKKGLYEIDKFKSDLLKTTLRREEKEKLTDQIEEIRMIISFCWHSLTATTEVFNFERLVIEIEALKLKSELLKNRIEKIEIKGGMLKK